MDETAATDEGKAQAEIRKLEAEAAKIKCEGAKFELEAEILRKPVWRQPAFISGTLAPLGTVLAAFCVFYATVLNNQQANLIKTNDALTSSIEKLQQKIDTSTTELERLKRDTTETKKDLETSLSTRKNLQADLDGIRQRIAEESSLGALREAIRVLTANINGSSKQTSNRVEDAVFVLQHNIENSDVSARQARVALLTAVVNDNSTNHLVRFRILGALLDATHEARWADEMMRIALQNADAKSWWFYHNQLQREEIILAERVRYAQAVWEREVRNPDMAPGIRFELAKSIAEWREVAEVYIEPWAEYAAGVQKRWLEASSPEEIFNWGTTMHSLCPPCWVNTIIANRKQTYWIVANHPSLLIRGINACGIDHHLNLEKDLAPGSSEESVARYLAGLTFEEPPELKEWVPLSIKPTTHLKIRRSLVNGCWVQISELNVDGDG